MKTKLFVLFVLFALIFLCTMPGAMLNADAFDTTAMVEISGTFNMGDAFLEGNADEVPVHSVILTAYYIDKYEVTNSQYCNYLNAEKSNLIISSVSVKDPTGTYEYYDLDGTGGGVSARILWSGSLFSVESGYENHPVIYVTWYGADAYAKYYKKRLPTEAEWECAARGGLLGKRYPWGDEAPDGTKANYNYLGGELTKAVGSYPANGYALYDISGNVYEWCSDWYKNDYYSSSPANDPMGPASGIQKARRGAAYTTTVDSYLRCSFRGGNIEPSWSDNNTGFRCAGYSVTAVIEWKEYKSR